MIHVVAIADDDRIRSLLGKTTMLVIDEAHHLTGHRSTTGRQLYNDVAAAVPGIERVLLLSATPALHNEQGFLEMLHLLDPETYRLDEVNEFRRRIEARQALAEIVAGLTPQNVLYLDHTLAQLAEMFPDDKPLQEQANALRAITDSMPDENDPFLIEAVGRVHAHLSEVYRLHRRVLRHRRRTVSGLTPDRSGAIIVDYTSTDMAWLSEAVEDWRFAETTASNGDPSGKSGGSGPDPLPKYSTTCRNIRNPGAGRSTFLRAKRTSSGMRSFLDGSSGGLEAPTSSKRERKPLSMPCGRFLGASSNS